MGAIADAWARLHISPIHDVLVARHSEPWRHYHVWSHPLTMLRRFEEAEREGFAIRDPEACVVFAGWHDSIYIPQAKGGLNEELSAQLCRDEAVRIFGHPSVKHASIATRATAGHRPAPESECPDIALMLDVDLSILGTGEREFDAYDTNIAREYAHVPKDEYRTGRAAVLKGFLERPRLYLTEWGLDRWEAKARNNLAKAIAALED